MDFIGLKHVTIYDGLVLDNNFNFNWSEKYYYPTVVNFKRPINFVDYIFTICLTKFVLNNIIYLSKPVVIKHSVKLLVNVKL